MLSIGTRPIRSGAAPVRKIQPISRSSFCFSEALTGGHEIFYRKSLLTNRIIVREIQNKLTPKVVKL